MYLLWKDFNQASLSGTGSPTRLTFFRQFVNGKDPIILIETLRSIHFAAVINVIQKAKENAIQLMSAKHI